VQHEIWQRGVDIIAAACRDVAAAAAGHDQHRSCCHDVTCGKECTVAGQSNQQNRVSSRKRNMKQWVADPAVEAADGRADGRPSALQQEGAGFTFNFSLT